MRFRSAFLIAICALALGGCGNASTTSAPAAPTASAPTIVPATAIAAAAIQVRDVWSRPALAMNDPQPTATGMGDMKPTAAGMATAAMDGATGVVYLTIHNAGGAPDRLLNAESPVAGSVEFHAEVDANGVMSMRPLDGVDIPAGGDVVFKPGAMHVMLVGLKRDLKAGDTFNLTLHFGTAGTMQVQSTVR